MYKFIMSHDRKMSHYVTLKKGDTITLKYKGHPNNRNYASSWYCELSANHRWGYENMLEHVQATNLINMFECSDIETPDDNNLKEYSKLLAYLVSDEMVAYKNIYDN